MAQIYSPPEDFPQPPEIDYQNYDSVAHQNAENEWLEQLSEYCRENGLGKYAGKIVRDGVADGYAMYMIFALRPLILIHIPLGDAWQSRWAHRWTSSDVRQMADQYERIQKMFSM